MREGLRREMMDCVVGGALRDRSCARRERWGRGSFRAFARGGSWCRRSYARSEPIPLSPRGVVWGRWVDLGRGLRREMMDCVVGVGNSRRDRLRGLREALPAGKVGLEGCLRGLSPDHDHLRRCVGAGFEASTRCSSRFDVVNGSVGMLFGRGCLRFGRSARL